MTPQYHVHIIVTLILLIPIDPIFINLKMGDTYFTINLITKRYNEQIN